MGILGNNAKTKLGRKTGTEGSRENLHHKVFILKSRRRTKRTKKLKDGDFAPKQAGNEGIASIKC